MPFFQILIALFCVSLSLQTLAKPKAKAKAKPRFLHNLKVKQSCEPVTSEQKSITLAGESAGQEDKTLEYDSGGVSNKTVLIIKQWHLSPKTITKGFKERYPQEANQAAIYRYLNERIRTKNIDLVVGEGCKGEIDDSFQLKFNGWDLESLRKVSQTKNFDRVLSHIPLKIEARHGDHVRTICADDEVWIQEGNLRLSNLRGWSGYLLRLSDTQAEPEKIALYADSAINLLKVDKATPTLELVKLIRSKMKEELDAFRKSLEERNTLIVKSLNEKNFKRAALVIGGLHAKDLLNKLQSAGLACEILEPSGYVREDEKLLEEFEQALL